MRIVQCNAIRIYYCNDAKKINDCLNTSQCGSGREAFVGCKFHRSAGVHLVLHCNGHHWKRRQLFYLLLTAVKPSSFNGKPSQPKSDLPCTGINSMPSNSCWHATWYPFCQVRLPMPKNMPRIHSIGISSCCSCHPGMSCLKADWHLLWTQACPGLCCCSSNVMWTQACPACTLPMQCGHRYALAPDAAAAALTMQWWVSGQCMQMRFQGFLVMLFFSCTS